MSYTSSCPYLAGPLGTGTYATSDNSGYTIYHSNSTYVVFSSNGAQSAVAAYGDLEGDSTLQEGTGAATYTDTNGNEISASSTGVFTDTTGKTVLTVSGSGTSSSPVVYNYTDSNGNSQNVTVHYATYTIQTNFGVSGIAEYSQSGVPLVSSIVYPDGSAYAFTYEPTPGSPTATTGRIASVTLRTGGVISYTYSSGNNGIESDGSTAKLTRTTTDGVGTYTRSGISSTGSTTTITDPAGNTGVYTFLENTAGFFYETAHSLYNGAPSGTPAEQVTVCYNGYYPCSSQSVNVPLIIIDTNTIRNGTTIGTETRMYTAAALLSDDGNAILDTQYAYQTFSGQNGIQFYRLASQKVLGGGGTLSAETTYNYDETTPNPTSGLPQHVAVSTSRGNLTSVHPGGYTQTLTYDDAGQVLSASDLNQNFTTFQYDSATDTFLTNVTYPAVNGIVLTKGFASDINTGLTTSSTDMNGNTTSYHYDGLLRPTEIDYPGDGKTTYTYTINQTSVEKYQTASTYANTETLYDGYGRVSRVAVANGQGANPWYQQDTCYDADGNLQFQSYRYQSTGFAASKVCSGSGDTYTHDVLGRVTNLQHSDATHIAYSYTGTATKVTDENGVSRIVQTDAIGRPSILCEISSNASMPGSGSPQSCGTTLSGTGFLTTYSYDWANAKTTVTQDAQTRIFQTDSLGRTILVQEPESGATTYSYAYNSTGLVVTRKRPRANQSSASVLTTTTTQYDKLGRVVSITYDDGVTPNKEFDYDTVNSAMQWSQSTTNLKGNLADMASGSGTTLTRDLFSYDTMGRVTAMWQCAPSICGTSSQAGRPLAFS